MTHLIKPIAIAVKGKGVGPFLKRIQTIGQRYGVTAGKMDRSLAQLSQMLQQFDCQATLPITTVALARNSGVIQKYQAQGIEFAVHGYRHIDHSQLSQTEQEAHFRKAAQLFKENGIHCEGFRCPYLRWNQDTLSALTETDYAYDSSNSLVWEVDQRHGTDSYYRALEFYGALPASEYLAIPKLDYERNLVRIPYCLPDDESLVERLVWSSPAEMIAVWPAMFRQIHQQGELFNLGLHPERTVECADSLWATMEEVKAVSSEVWRARLNEIADWWYNRYHNTDIQIVNSDDGTMQFTVNGPEGTTILVRSVETKGAAEPWFDGYQRMMEQPCIVQTDTRPIIGVSPESTPDLAGFLKQNGYIVEESSHPEHYSYYLDRKTFSPVEEKPLLAEIENNTFPLVRLGRWPHGYRSVFCVTGDIDALTIWDYGLRFIGH